MTVAISGASGFVGTHLLSACRQSGLACIAVVFRSGSSAMRQLPHADALVHLGAIAHSDASNQSEVMAANRDLTIEVARSARNFGYRHFVFMSSALVWGSNYDCVQLGTLEKPDTAYGRAKLEAEQVLLATQSSDWNVSIIRPPLLYGAGVKGNLAKLLRAVHLWPICPLGVDTNRRSLANVENLSAFIVHLLVRNLSGQYCLQDEKPISTLGMLERMAAHMPHHGRVVRMPRGLRHCVRAVAPRTARQLFGSLVIEDNTAAKAGFAPPHTMEDGFAKMVHAYLDFTSRRIEL
jgi:nucleoside-diphosphate-sugar epimerase